MNGLPEAFLNRMQKQLGDELPAFLYAMDKKPVRGIRFNPLKPEGFIRSGMNGFPGRKPAGIMQKTKPPA